MQSVSQSVSERCRWDAKLKIWNFYLRELLFNKAAFKMYVVMGTSCGGHEVWIQVERPGLVCSKGTGNEMSILQPPNSGGHILRLT